MSTIADKVAASPDERRLFLVRLKDYAPKFHRELLENFVTDKVTFTGIEKDFIKALAHVKNIHVFATTSGGVVIENTDGNTLEFESYEEAFSEIIELIEEDGLKLYPTTFFAFNYVTSRAESFEGKPIYATSHYDAQELCRKTMPYLKVGGITSEVIDLANKALKL